MNDEVLQQYLGMRPFRYFPSTLSTMSDAQAWLAEQPTLPSGSVIIANEQRAGRGRLGRQWLTPPGSAIAMSVILHSEYSPQHLTMAGSLAVAEALEAYTPGLIALKWSNDVLLSGKKVAGILAEAVWEGNHLVASVLAGIGVNLEVNFEGTELADLATSLHTHTSQPIERPALIATILERLDHWMVASKRQSPLQTVAGPALYHAWKDRLATLGQQVTVLLNDGSSVPGKAVDVDADGALILENPQGERRRFLVGDVRLHPIKQP